MTDHPPSDSAPPSSREPSSSDAPRLLVVDDEPGFRHSLERHLGAAGYEVDVAEDGLDAWERLSNGAGRYAAVVLDVCMPRMTGMDLLARMKATPELEAIPVVVQTGAASPSEVRAGLEAGAFYYLTKPYEREVLLAIVRSAVDDLRRLRRLRRDVAREHDLMPLLVQGSFELYTLAQAKKLATFLARAFPDPARAVVGLIELLVNAVEHGSLGITYDEKSELIQAGEYDREMARRAADPVLAARRVRVSLVRTGKAITTTIEDEGAGFEWRDFIDYDPARAFDPNGRGIAMARAMSFDDLTYEGVGNRVVARVDVAPKPASAGRGLALTIRPGAWMTDEEE